MNVELLLSLFGAVSLLVAGFWAVGRWAMGQYEKRLDERFAGQEKARVEGSALYKQQLASLEAAHRELERAFLKHLSELPRDYVRREDHIRFETVIHAKMDAVAAKLDLVQERMPRREQV